MVLWGAKCQSEGVFFEYSDFTTSLSFKQYPILIFYSSTFNVIQDVSEVKVTISEFNSRADAKSKTSYTRGSNSQRFGSYEFLEYSK